MNVKATVLQAEERIRPFIRETPLVAPAFAEDILCKLVHGGVAIHFVDAAE